jgi:hypothetical protein
MAPKAIVIAVAAGLGIVALLIFGGDERGFSERVSAQPSTRPGVQLAAVAGIAHPEDAIVVVVNSELLSDEIEARLEEAREQLATAREQLAAARDEAREQAQAQARELLEQANQTLDDALERIEDEAEDTDNLARQSRLEKVHAALTSIQDQIEAWLEQL